MAKNVLEYLENSSALYPDKIAVRDELSECSYSSLLNDAKKIGTAISKIYQPNSPVAVFLNKSVNTLKIFLGAVYGGCFYVLINPDLPQVRINQILNTLKTSKIITDSENAEQAHRQCPECEVLLYEDLVHTDIDDAVLTQIRKSALDTDPLYTNFTSGSTGVPKGVVICHRSVIDFIDEFTDLFNITHNDIIGNQAPFDFDVSVKDIYSALKVGATLEIIPKSLFSSPAKLLDYICDKQITTLIWAVSALCLVSSFHGLDYRIPESVNKILFSGEAMPIKHLNNWMKALPNAQFVNLYGPTEITCNCTYYKVKRDVEYETGLPIGTPFANERVFLLDSENQLVNTPNVKGEICVSGTCLALGYFNNREQTDKAFVQNPLNSNYNELIYKTGDLAYYSVDGNLYFAGRKDFQVKYMGHRIELEEIERAISKIPAVERACCIFIEQKGRLKAFYVGDITSKEIRHCLSVVLPVYMIPNSYKQLDEMPVTKNGKINRAELSQM